ncbi:NlpC/P60 family protein [Streptomyces phyllanthi]|uniref:NlpC/P60 family protein n=1 Tax=Streptomyces phyllanthi TaxID=1803180 RepID=A0A5N8W8M3_9ACTN|nr:C40 family peptidase [Streptomyces phyllanthi]MPY43679.1 NlpC/P60 family protein [Streptomyces phyllanthi]
MAAHRRPRQRPLSGTPTRTAATIALAGAASATGLHGTGHAEPQLTAGQVKARVTKLYEEAEVATEKYNGAKEQADKARERLEDLRDEAARRMEGLNSTREKLGSMAAAQYRAGGIDPAVQLALSDDPDVYLDGAAFAERMGSRQASDVARVRQQLREIERLRGAATIELSRLTSRQAELKRHKLTINGKLGEVRHLLAQLPENERAGLDAAGRTGPGSPSSASPASSASSARGLGPVSAVSPQAPSSRAAAALSYAYGKLGSPYVWGATGPDAFDCSGLTQAAYRAAGVSLPRTTYAQIGAGQHVARDQLLPGDLVFFYSGVSHVGIYVGNGQMIHAPRPGEPVRVAPLDLMPFAGATRVG